MKRISAFLKRHPAFAILAIALFMASINPPLSGCAWWQTKGKEAAKDAIDCVVESARSHGQQALVNRIYEILAGKPADWSSSLIALEAAGWDALGCAFQAVIGSLDDKEKVAAAGGLKLQASTHKLKSTWLKDHLAKRGFKFAKAKGKVGAAQPDGGPASPSPDASPSPSPSK